MAGYQQQDAHEFLIAFLDGLDKHLKLNHQPSPLSHHPHGLSITLPSVVSYPQDILGPPNDVSPPVRKSPRSESKHRSFTLGSTTPAMLRRSNSDNEPSSNGSVTFIPRVADVLDVRLYHFSFVLVITAYVEIFCCMFIGISWSFAVASDVPRMWARE